MPLVSLQVHVESLHDFIVLPLIYDELYAECIDTLSSHSGKEGVSIATRKDADCMVTKFHKYIASMLNDFGKIAQLLDP